MSWVSPSAGAQPATQERCEMKRDFNNWEKRVMDVIKDQKLISAVLDKLPGDVLFHHYGDQSAQVLYDEMTWRLENTEQKWSRMEVQWFHRDGSPTPFKILEYSARDDRQFFEQSSILTRLPQGALLALDVLAKRAHYMLQCSVAEKDFESCLLGGQPKIDVRMLYVCEAIARDKTLTAAQLKMAYETVCGARKEQQEWFARIKFVSADPGEEPTGPENKYLSRAVKCLGLEHTKRTSVAAARKVSEGRLLEEFVEDIAEYYVVARWKEASRWEFVSAGGEGEEDGDAKLKGETLHEV